MKGTTMTSLLWAAAWLSVAWPSTAAVLTVVGQNDITVDRPAIQDAIDAAAPGDTVLLEGSFQLDGTHLSIERELRLRGLALDNDGDGQINEDWADGLDGDGDGLVDEDDWDATLFGIVDELGQPVPETDPGLVFNRAIFVRGLDREVRGLSIEGLRFSGHHRAITLEPDTGSSGGTACENLFSTAGSLDRPRVQRNRFDNNNRGVELEGATIAGVIRENILEQTADIAFIVEGQQMGCPLLDGGFETFDTFEIGQPIDTVVSSNVALGNGLLGVFLFGADGTRLKDNTFEGGFVGILSQGDEQVEIKANDISGAVFGLDLLDPAGNGRVKDNTIDGGTFGVLLDIGAEGWKVKGNEFSNVELFEVFIDGEATGNTVWVGPDDRVLDLGIDNTIIVE